MQDTTPLRKGVSKGLKIGRSACLAGGACLLAAAIGAAIHTRRFIHHSISATGTVVSMSTRRDNDDMKVTYAPVFAFTAIDGTTYTVSSNSGSNPPEFAVGDQVKVLYEAKNPSNARIDSFLQLWLWTFCFGFIGAVATLIGSVFLRIERSRAAQKTLSSQETVGAP